MDANYGEWSWGEGEHSLSSWIHDCNRETFLCVQIETRAAVANIEEMAAVPGVDLFFVGPGDLGWRLKPEVSNALRFAPICLGPRVINALLLFLHRMPNAYDPDNLFLCNVPHRPKCTTMNMAIN